MDNLAGAMLAFGFGASLGSFAGAVAYRWPREISIVAPRSFCPHCHKAIAYWCNIPLLSYLLLGGRCRQCHAAIGFRYFLTELLLGSAAMFLYLHFPLGEALARFAFCVALLIIAIIDYDWRVIPDLITLGGIPLGFLAATFLMPEIGWKSSLSGMLVGAGFLFLTGLLYRLIRGTDGVALGDVYLLGMIGSFLGWTGAVFTLFFGSVLGSLGGLAIATAGWTSPAGEATPAAIATVYADAKIDPLREKELPLLQTPVPFGPFLALAAAIFALFQPQLLRWYFA